MLPQVITWSPRVGLVSEEALGTSLNLALLLACWVNALA